MITLHTNFKLPDDIVNQAQSESTRTLKPVHVLRQTDPAGKISYALTSTLPQMNTPRNSHVATIDPDIPSEYTDQLAHIAELLQKGKNVLIAVPNHETKAKIRRELALPKDLVIIGDHPDVTFFGRSWLVFNYTTLQNTLQNIDHFDIAYYVQGENLTPMATECESENLALLEKAQCQSIRLNIPKETQAPQPPRLKTRISAKLAIATNNQPGFVNDGAWYNPSKPRKPFVTLPCVYLEKPGDDLYKSDTEFAAEVRQEAQDTMQYYHLQEIPVYDRNGQIIETLQRQESEAASN